MSYRRLAKVVSAVAVLGCALAPPLLVAQDAAQQAEQAARTAAPGLDPNSLAGKDATEGVYVRDSALALDKLNLAQKMERLKEWDKSADLYQEVIDKYPDRVVPSRLGADDKIVQYTSVTRGVMERLAKWPNEGLDVYRTRYEPSAAQLVEQAGGPGARADLAGLHRVFYRYFVTDTARDVGVRLVDVNLERGEFQAAARLADELLSLHPNLGDERPALLYRAAIAHRLAGDPNRAKERLATLQKNHADAAGTVRGNEVKLADSLATELQAITTTGSGGAPVASSADSWMTLGGDASRGRVTPGGGRPAVRLYGVPLARPNVRLPGNVQAQFDQLSTSAMAAGQMTGIFPVVDRGELFFQDGTRVYARSLESGNPLPGWLQTYPGEREGQYVLPNAVGAPRTHQLTLTLTDRAVLGVMGQPDRHLFNVGGAQVTEPRLVNLDRRTGRENWVVALSGLELPKDLADDQQKAIRGLQMNGAPLVVGDSVLVAARGVKQAQFEDCWVLCFQLATGKYRWSCYVASANNVGSPWGMQTSAVESTTHLAYADGRVYVMSNLGALAALDAYSGTIVWLDIYQRAASPVAANGNFAPNFQGGGMMSAADKPWTFNPVIVKDGHVFALPNAGRNLYVYDADTGAELKRIDRGDYGNAELLLGVVGERMVIAGEKKVFCIDWRKYDPEKPDDALAWSSVDFPDGLRGRPLVTEDYVFVTDANRLSMLEMKGGRVREAYPKNWKPWDEREEGPGNVLVTADHVVIAGPTHVYGFTDLGLARARLDKAVAAAPREPAPQLRYAEILFAAGDPAGAAAKLDEAIERLGGAGAMRQGGDRDWLFNAALTFAQKLAGTGAADAEQAAPTDEQRKHAAALYDRAAQAASSPQQQVHYRLSRARFAEATRDAAAAAKLYQEILSEPELRPVPLLDETSGGPTQAGDVAEAAIASLIGKAGVAVYAPFEAAAAAALAEAKAAAPPEPDRLLAVAQTYPNAKVAPQALLAAADAYEAAGSPRPAVQVLRQVYFKYPGATAERPRVIEAMARNYLALPNRAEVAAARLAQGAELAGDPKLTKPLRLPDGKEIAAGTTFAKALDEIRKFSGQSAAKNLPDFRLPVPPRYPPAAERLKNPRWPFPPAGGELVIDGVTALAAPLRDFARADRVVAWSADGARLAVYEPGNAKPLGTGKVLNEAPVGSAWVGNDGVVVWSPAAVALVGERGGDAAWRVTLDELPDLEVVKPAGAGAEVAQVQRLPAGVVIRGNVQFGGRRFPNQPFVMQDGVLRLQPAAPAAPNRPDPNAAEQVTEVRPVGDRVLVTSSTGRLACVDLASGRVAWQTRLADRPIDRVAANEDFTVVKVSDEARVQLVAMDTVTGQIRGSRAYPVQQGDVPVNIALSADGTLVFTTPNKLMLKDLYKPWDESEREAGVVPGQAIGAPPFLNATGPDQLVIAEGRILALAEAGHQQTDRPLKKYVRVHSLETGQPIPLRVPQDGGMVDLQLTAGTETWDVKLRVIGPRLYVINPRTVLCYNLDRPEEFWDGQIDDSDEQSVPNVDEAFFGQNHVVLLSRPGVPQPRKGTHQLLAYGRYPGKSDDTAESGRLDYEPTIVEQQPVTAWQGVAGGFYYLTGDGKLHYLAAQ